MPPPIIKTGICVSEDMAGKVIDKNTDLVKGNKEDYFSFS